MDKNELQEKLRKEELKIAKLKRLNMERDIKFKEQLQERELQTVDLMLNVAHDKAEERKRKGLVSFLFLILLLWAISFGIGIYRELQGLT